jgi:hypothetical protein
MASKKVNIDISTTANTAGADQTASSLDGVSKSLFKVQTEAEKAQSAIDVAAVKNKQSFDATAAAADAYERQLEEIRSATERLVAANLADAVGKISKAFGDFGPEAELAITGVQNFLNVLANTGDPIKASFAVVGTAIGGVVNSFTEAERKSKELDKSMKEHAQSMAIVRSQILASIKAEGMSEFFQKETDKINQQIDAIERREKVRASIISAQAAVGDLADTSGMNEGVAEAAKINSETTAKLGEIDWQVSVAAEILAKANEAASAANLALSEAKQREGAGGPSVANLESIVKQKEAEAAKFQEKLQDLMVTSEADKTKLLAESTKQIESIGLETGQTMFQNLEDLKTELAAEVQRQGANASIAGRSALENLTTVLADSQIKPEEFALIGTAFQQLNSSTEQLNNKIISSLNIQYSQNTAAFNQITTMTNQITNKLNGTISALNAIQNRLNKMSDPKILR